MILPERLLNLKRKMVDTPRNVPEEFKVLFQMSTSFSPALSQMLFTAISSKFKIFLFAMRLFAGMATQRTQFRLSGSTTSHQEVTWKNWLNWSQAAIPSYTNTIPTKITTDRFLFLKR